MTQTPSAISTPDLCDEHSDHLQILEPGFHMYGLRKQFSGQVVTVKCFEDNSRVKELSEEDGSGKVMVVDAGGSLRHALLGDLIAERLVANHWQGFIINGCVRDVEALNKLDFGIRALNSVPLKSIRRGVGEIDVPIRFAGASIKPGQFIYADETGIIVSDTPLLSE